MLKPVSGGILTSLKASPYQLRTAFRLLRPCRNAFLNILLEGQVARLEWN